jgi:hypothetical protein
MQPSFVRESIPVNDLIRSTGVAGRQAHEPEEPPEANARQPITPHRRVRTKGKLT